MVDKQKLEGIYNNTYNKDKDLFREYLYDLGANYYSSLDESMTVYQLDNCVLLICDYAGVQFLHNE